MKFLDIFFCDDIRHELGQKMSLMGIYSNRIQVFSGNKMFEAEKIAPFNLSVFLHFEKSLTEKTPDRFEFEYILNDKSIVKVTDQFNVANLEKFNIAIKGLGVPLERGFLGFSVSLYDKNQVLLNEKQGYAIKIV